MNTAAWGLDKLVEPALLLQNPEFLHQDLQATKVTGCPLKNSVSWSDATSNCRIGH